MPVFLPRDQKKSCLDRSLGKNGIQAILQPYNIEAMEAYPVSKVINKLGFNTANPDVLKRQDYRDLASL